MNCIHISTLACICIIGILGEISKYLLTKIEKYLNTFQITSFSLQSLLMEHAIQHFLVELHTHQYLLPLNIEWNVKIFVYEYWKILKHIPSNKFFSAVVSWVCYSTFFSWILYTSVLLPLNIEWNFKIFAYKDWNKY